MTLLARRTAAVLAATALLASGTSTVHAKDLRLVDPADDVWVQGFTYSEPTLQPSTEADVRRVLVRHTNRIVLVRATFDDLTRSGYNHSLTVRLKTNERVKRQVTLLTSRDDRAGAARMTRGAKSVSCSVGRKVDYGRDTMTVRIPRSCLSSPRWVKVRVENGWVPTDQLNVYVDNPHDDQASFSGWSKRLGVG